MLVTVITTALLAVWVLAPHPLEGPVVWSFTDDRGVHLGDLVGVAVAAVVAAGLGRA